MNYEAINRKAKREEEHMQSPVYYFITLENLFVSFCEIIYLTQELMIFSHLFLSIFLQTVF